MLMVLLGNLRLNRYKCWILAGELILSYIKNCLYFVNLCYTNKTLSASVRLSNCIMASNRS